ACWGPYQVHPDLWCRALRQKQRLESGQVRYKACDGGSCDGQVFNCVHAIEFLIRGEDTSRQVIIPSANRGQTAPYWLDSAMRPWYLDPCRTHDWLLPYLGVNPDGVIHEGLDHNPAWNPVTRGVQAALHPQLLGNRVGCDR